jgi:hypothetical protein
LCIGRGFSSETYIYETAEGHRDAAGAAQEGNATSLHGQRSCVQKLTLHALYSAPAIRNDLDHGIIELSLCHFGKFLLHRRQQARGLMAFGEQAIDLLRDL